MTPTPRTFPLASLALAASALLAGCGGGSAGAPDIFDPTVTITDNVDGTADGPVTFTFTFSEDVGSTFTLADDILVTGGTPGTLTKVNATQYTLVVTPPEGSVGTIQVTVAAGSVSDRVGNLNTVNPTVAQAFSTPTLLLSFDEASSPFTFDPGVFGDAALAFEAGPTGGSGNALKLTRSGALNFGGTFFGVAPIPFTADRKTITARVYSTRAGAVVYLKVEVPGGGSVEVPATVSAANTWETLTWNLAGVNPANSYSVMVISADTDVAIGGTQTYWIDDVTLAAAPVGGGGGGPLTFASGYKSNNRTVEDGEWGFYSGNFTDYAYTFAGGCFTDGGGDCGVAVPASDTFVYLGVGTSAPTTDGFMGIYTMAPGYTGGAPNAGVTLSGQTTMKIELGWTPEFYAQGSNNELLVRTIGAEVYSNGSGGFCQILLEKLVPPTTANLTEYTITLSSMTLAQGCNAGGFTSGVTSVAEALTKAIGEVHVQAVYPRVNITQPPGGPYPTGFVRGSIVFQ